MKKLRSPFGTNLNLFFISDDMKNSIILSFFHSFILLWNALPNPHLRQRKDFFSSFKGGARMAGRYDDLLRLPRPESRHPRMTMEARAAQFAPFAALSGYEDVIREAARLTTEPIVLAEDAREELSRRLTFLARRVSERPTVRITWFQPDARKVGGEYVTKTVTVRRVDGTVGYLELDDRSLIPIGAITELGGDLFLDAEAW